MNMTIEKLTAMFALLAKEAIEEIESHNDGPISWGQTDEIGSARSGLRQVLSVLSQYKEDLPAKEAVLWVGDKLKWPRDQIILDEALRRHVYGQ